jgi:hypothetical protein
MPFPLQLVWMFALPLDIGYSDCASTECQDCNRLVGLDIEAAYLGSISSLGPNGKFFGRTMSRG